MACKVALVGPGAPTGLKLTETRYQVDQPGMAWRAAGRPADLTFKIFLIGGQIVRLLCIGERRILLSD
jgi:hypothetical protein